MLNKDSPGDSTLGEKQVKVLVDGVSLIPVFNKLVSDISSIKSEMANGTALETLQKQVGDMSSTARLTKLR